MQSLGTAYNSVEHDFTKKHFTDAVTGIVVDGNKVTGDVICFHKIDKVFNPCARGCGRASDLQLAVHRFDCLGRDFIQVEIVSLRAGEEGGHVRLVPDLKVPCLDLFHAVAVQQELDEGADKLLPLGIVLAVLTAR